MAGAIGLFLLALAGVPGQAGAAGNCPNEAVREQQTSTPLPDCRAYEMISPVSKNGGDVTAQTARVATDGSTILFQSAEAFEGTQGSPASSFYMGHRQAAGWISEPISPALAPAPLALFNYTNHTSDLSRSVLATTDSEPRLDPAAPPASFLLETFNLYVRDNHVGTYRFIGQATGPRDAGASDDLSTVVFSSVTGQAPGAAPGVANLYRWDNGQVRLVSILPSGEAAPGGAKIAGSNFSAVHEQPYAVSADGSRIYFESLDTGQLYLRDGNATVRVNASEKSSPDPTPSPATFLGASSDGSVAVFISSEQLVDADQNSAPDLYRYDAEATGSKLTMISEDHEPADGEAAEAVGLAGISTDGAYVYFGTESQIIAGEPISPGTKLYVWHQGDPTFIAARIGFDAAVFRAGQAIQQARYTPDGRRFAFTSSQQLTAYDNRDAQGTPQLEAYVYDALSDTILCASCRPDGSRPTGGSEVPQSSKNPSSNYVSGALSPDGSRLVFSSSDAVLPEDTNGKQDIYLWENGNVHLISSGRGSRDSWYAEMSPSGDDVYFTTADRLVSQDVDDNYDLYDARVRGGLPEPPPPSPRCAGEECQLSSGGDAGSAGVLAATETVTGGGRRRVRANVRLGALVPARLGSFARSGKLTLRVRVNRAGPIIARSDRGPSTIVRATGPGTERITLRLSRAAKRSLREAGHLTIHVSVRFLGVVRTITMNLRRSK